MPLPVSSAPDGFDAQTRAEKGKTIRHDSDHRFRRRETRVGTAFLYPCRASTRIAQISFRTTQGALTFGSARAEGGAATVRRRSAKIIVAMETNVTDAKYIPAPCVPPVIAVMVVAIKGAVPPNMEEARL